ncbi:hypothetical protein RI367_005066 [Sorochytrium milnesiophthora]
MANSGQNKTTYVDLNDPSYALPLWPPQYQTMRLCDTAAGATCPQAPDSDSADDVQCQVTNCQNELIRCKSMACIAWTDPLLLSYNTTVEVSVMRNGGQTTLDPTVAAAYADYQRILQSPTRFRDIMSGVVPSNITMGMCYLSPPIGAPCSGDGNITKIPYRTGTGNSTADGASWSVARCSVSGVIAGLQLKGDACTSDQDCLMSTCQSGVCGGGGATSSWGNGNGDGGDFGSAPVWPGNNGMSDNDYDSWRTPGIIIIVGVVAAFVGSIGGFLYYRSYRHRKNVELAKLQQANLIQMRMAAQAMAQVARAGPPPGDVEQAIAAQADVESAVQPAPPVLASIPAQPAAVPAPTPAPQPADDDAIEVVTRHP